MAALQDQKQNASHFASYTQCVLFKLCSLTDKTDLGDAFTLAGRSGATRPAKVGVVPIWGITALASSNALALPGLWAHDTISCRGVFRCFARQTFAASGRYVARHVSIGARRGCCNALVRLVGVCRRRRLRRRKKCQNQSRAMSKAERERHGCRGGVKQALRKAAKEETGRRVWLLALAETGGNRRPGRP